MPEEIDPAVAPAAAPVAPEMPATPAEPTEADPAAPAEVPAPDAGAVVEEEQPQA